MIDLSLAGLLGAIVGTIAAALVYGPLATLVERGFRSRDASASAEERRTFEQEMSMLRRGVLAADVLVLAGIGYWLGKTIGG
jgi:hypothetical protein